MSVVALKPVDHIDREETERLANSIERDTGRLLEMMQDRARRELIGVDLYRLGLSAIRLNTILEEFRDENR